MYGSSGRELLAAIVGGLALLVGVLIDPDMYRRYWRPILRAQKRAAYCITEAEAGSDVAGIKTTAVAAADG